MTNEEIYQQATLESISENPQGTRMDVIYKAMDLAREQGASDERTRHLKAKAEILEAPEFIEQSFSGSSPNRIVGCGDRHQFEAFDQQWKKCCTCGLVKPIR